MNEKEATRVIDAATEAVLILQDAITTAIASLRSDVPDQREVVAELLENTLESVSALDKWCGLARVDTGVNRR